MIGSRNRCVDWIGKLKSIISQKHSNGEVITIDQYNEPIVIVDKEKAEEYDYKKGH
ncbi:1844_t:CDS:2 [Entrophospora sp. SA101]|nr:4739_t:CDS:2 [Entrophospora sp. SA101]CAJ0645864.1 8191_t:CDS:2 [Entrophospora sp. SA101]CAJ0746635.1 1844_t:CDS:2 [Entrophospora sp. SA101]CAJ0824284.1 7910_t:CDS:2 [Entrophospora sp. SA101]CAJ0857431.1 11094_t:CDS:2 [Entrophospora sp. SA101]